MRRGIGFQSILYQQVFAESVEPVRIQSRLVGTRQPLAQLDVKHLEAQPAGGIAIFPALGQTQPIAANLRVNVRLFPRRGPG